MRIKSLVMAGVIAAASLIVMPFAHAEGIDPASFKTIDRNKKNSIITIAHENDLLASGSDQYYTSGFQATYYNIDRRPPPFIQGLSDRLFDFEVGAATATSFFIGQKIFTPRDISISEPQPNDRPWAGWLYTGVSMTNISTAHTDKVGVVVGVVGPASLAEQSQKAVHKYITNSQMPEGWDHQLHNEPGLILTWDRRWPNYWTADVRGYRLQFEPNITAALGNVYTYGGTGVTLTFGPNQAELRDTPPRIFPAMPGSGYFDVPRSRQWDWYVFAGLNARAVARDIFLDGNTFKDSPSIEKKNFVLDSNVGLAMTYHDYRISYTLTHRTREFEGQDSPSVFGAISLSRRF